MMPEFQTPFIELSKVTLVIKNHIILEDINLTIEKETSLSISGASGSGKTTLATLISNGKGQSSGSIYNPLKTVFVSQQDNFSEVSGMASTYYSKRYEFHEYEKQLSVSQYLYQINKKEKYTEGSILEDELLDSFHVSSLLDKNLMQLSNGERKKLQLVVAIFQAPELLILDQPFTGLDVAARKELSEFFHEVTQQGVTLILICGTEEIPPFIDRSIVLEKGKVAQDTTPFSIKNIEVSAVNIDENIDLSKLLKSNDYDYNIIVEMKGVNVSMSGKSILKNIDWLIKPGECWALLGHNGAGKSTLLSLITADNPQGYNNHLVLFDIKRGSGESIWDIKQKIGFLSPELHLYFMRGRGVINSVPGMKTTANHYSTLTCSDVIISGFKDEIGTVSIPIKNQEEIASDWLILVGLSHLKSSLFINASLGEQRVLLLLRALVKNPPLLILDEPCQGMDSNQIQYFKELLDYICKSKEVTMIYVSHRKEEIPNSVTKTLTLSKGKIV